MSDLPRLLARCPHVLLDFDGPVCSVFGGTSDRAVADALRTHLGDELPIDVTDSSDPFDVLRHAATIGPACLARTNIEFTALEVDAVNTATPTPGAVEAITALRRTGHTVTIVSNNSTDAVSVYLARHALVDLISGISARSQPDPDLLKPSPHLLRRAMSNLQAQSNRCVFIGDSETDLIAAGAAGAFAVGYANKLGKRQRLSQFLPESIVDTMFEIANASA